MTSITTGTRADEAGTALTRFAAKFGVLKDAIPELWIVFGIKFLVIAAYGLTNLTIVLWLENDLGYSDTQALPLVAAWSMTMTVATLLVGSLSDALGIRRTLFLGIVICLVARSVMVLVTSRWLALSAGLMLLAIGEAMSAPVLIAAVRRFSNTRQRSISFSLIYVMMNAGLLVAAWLFDKIRRGLGEQGQAHLFGITVSTYRTLFLGSLILEVLLLPLICLLREGAEANDEGTKGPPPAPERADAAGRKSGFIRVAMSGSAGASPYQAPGRASLPASRETDNSRFAPDAAPVPSPGLTLRGTVQKTARLFAALVKQPGFYRLLAFLVLIAFIKLIYRQMDYVYPTFGIRELGPGAPVGMLWGMNSLYIIVLAPVIGALTQKYPAYAMVTVGAVISSASIFIMALPPVLFQTMADGFPGNLVGHWLLGLQGAVHPYYVMISLFVLVLSVGEAFYSPRVYEYAAAIAPKGQEASYGALSYVPFLLSKLLIGTFSGESLMRYCPPTGPRHSQSLWLIVALWSLVAPVGLILLRPLIRLHEAGRDEGKAEG